MQKLKLSQRTIQIFKNFSSINPSVHIKPGKSIATISSSKSIMAKAVIEEEFETEFAIYDISRFLSALSLFKEPEIAIDKGFATIAEDKKKMNYVFADPKTVISPPDKRIVMPSNDVDFRLTNDVMSDVNKIVSVLRLPEIMVQNSGNKITIGASDSKNSTSDNFAIEVGETDKKFRFIFKSENIKIMPGDYDVIISAKGISQFNTTDLTYFIAVESNSNFET